MDWIILGVIVFSVPFTVLGIYILKCELEMSKLRVLEKTRQLQIDAVNLYRKGQFEKLKLWLDKQETTLMDHLINNYPFQKPNESSLDYKEGYRKALEHVQDYVEKLEREAPKIE